MEEDPPSMKGSSLEDCAHRTSMESGEDRMKSRSSSLKTPLNSERWHSVRRGDSGGAELEVSSRTELTLVLQVVVNACNSITTKPILV